MRTFLTLFWLLILFTWKSNQVSAEFINVIAATASGTQAGSALDTVNGSGFTPDPLGSDLGTHIADINTHWLGGPGTGTSSFINHDLYYLFNSTQTLESILFWNYNDGTNPSRGVRSMWIWTSLDPTAFNNPGHVDWSPVPLASPTEIPNGPGNDSTLYGTEIDVPDTDALVVRFRTRQSWGNSFNIGFAETRFLTTASVPEPSSLLMVAAAGLISLSVRNRRRR